MICKKKGKGNPNYIRGRAFEYHIVNHYKKLGYQAVRSSGSHSPWDVTAVKDDKPIYAQAKTFKKKPSFSVIKKDVISLMKLAKNPYIKVELWIKGKRKIDKWIICPNANVEFYQKFWRLL